MLVSFIQKNFFVIHVKICEFLVVNGRAVRKRRQASYLNFYPNIGYNSGLFGLGTEDFEVKIASIQKTNLRI